MKTYRITDFLDHHACVIAANASYLRHSSVNRTALRTEGNLCPIGVAVREMGCRTGYQPDEVARFFTGYDRVRFGARQHEIYYAAVDFMRDWDMGHITNLRHALGVEVAA